MIRTAAVPIDRLVPVAFASRGEHVLADVAVAERREAEVAGLVGPDLGRRVDLGQDARPATRRRSCAGMHERADDQDQRATTSPTTARRLRRKRWRASCQ